MARTVTKNTRVYVGGYDLSGFGRSIGPLELTHDEADETVWTDAVKGYLRNHAHANVGTLNAVLEDTATTGSAAVLNAPGGKRVVTAVIGFNAAPAAGDMAFAGEFLQKAYQVTEDGGAVTISAEFAGWASDAVSLAHGAPFGALLHANAAATGANSSAGLDFGAATAKGGFLVYHVLAGDGLAEISIDDSADNSNWTALSGATTGALDCSARAGGLVALATTATVRRYLRWQIALDTATTVTFVLSFHRNY